MLLLLDIFKKKKTDAPFEQAKASSQKQVATRKGEIGEYKIDIQLDQLPKDCRYLSDLLIRNPKAKSGYSQIDHVVLTPYGIFVIETKNYLGTIYGGKDRKTWSVNGKFQMMNPFIQNYGHIKALSSLMDQTHQDLFISMVSFTKRCTFKVDLDYRKIASNEIIVYDIELSEFLHRKISVLKIQHKEPLLGQSEISMIYDTFSKADIKDSTIRQEHEHVLKISSAESNSKWSCSICNKPVSDKVKTYCLSNNKFNGKVFCFEHQKAVH